MKTIVSLLVVGCLSVPLLAMEQSKEKVFEITEFEVDKSQQVGTKNQASWDGKAYDANSEHQYKKQEELFEAYADWIRLDECKNIIDVGCGSGRATKELLADKARQANVVGVDFSESMIKEAKEGYRASNLKFKQADGQKLPEKYKEKFDLLLSQHVIHWMSDHEAFVKSAGLVLASGGKLLVGGAGKAVPEDGRDYIWRAVKKVAEKEQWKQLFAGLGGAENFEDKNHSIDPESMKKWLTEAGFGDIKIENRGYTDCYFDSQEKLAGFFKALIGAFSANKLPDAMAEKLTQDVAAEYKGIIEQDSKIPQSTDGSIVYYPPYPWVVVSAKKFGLGELVAAILI